MPVRSGGASWLRTHQQALHWLHEEDCGATETCIAEAYNGRRRVYRVEKRYLRKDGGIMWADVSLVFVPANGSNAAFFSAVIIDGTERK